jgi:hypothetical protein
LEFLLVDLKDEDEEEDEDEEGALFLNPWAILGSRA